MTATGGFTWRICAVLSSDVSGYSALVGRDGEATAEAVHRLQVVREIAAEAHGRARRGQAAPNRQSAWRYLRGAAASMLLLLACTAQSRTLSDIFTEDLAGLDLGPMGPALANTVAQTYPVASASASVTYVFNPATDAFERQTRVLGPTIGERAETIGEGQLDLALSYSYVSLDSINGMSLSHLVNKPSINGKVVSFPVPGGVTLADGRITKLSAVYVNADMIVEAQILAPQ